MIGNNWLTINKSAYVTKNRNNDTLYTNNSNVKTYFNEILQENIEEAIRFINNNNLSFSSLFMLKDDIENHNLYDKLCHRNRFALDIAHEIMNSTGIKSSSTNTSCDKVQIIKHVLNWIIKTGVDDNIQLDDYDQLLDGTAALLTRVFKETSILPIIAGIIFDRYRKGYFVNNLVWAFFEGKNPQSLIYIANYLLSSNSRDVQLAQKLLKFIPNINIGNPSNQYWNFLNWLKENIIFLHYTGEGFQQSHTPIPYVVVLEGKYLNKAVSLETGKIIEVLTGKEKELLYSFSKLDDDTKVLLSTFSYQLSRKDPYYWYSWINYTIAEQIRVARFGAGGRI